MADSNTPDLRTVWFGLSPRAANWLRGVLDDEIADPDRAGHEEEAVRVFEALVSDIDEQIKALPSAEKFHEAVMGEAEGYVGPADPEEAVADLTHEAAQSQAAKVAAKMAKAARKAAEGEGE